MFQLDASKAVGMMSQYPKTIAALLLIGTPTVCLLRLHKRLSRRVHHSLRSGPFAYLIPPTQHIKSIPPSEQTDDNHAIYDKASITIPTARLPSSLDGDELLIRYLRRNMTCFTRFPQALLLRLVSKGPTRKTFSPSHIQRLNFDEGDVICGMYEVIHRGKNRVEFELKPQGGLQGRLVITIERKGEETHFLTQTAMWKQRGNKKPMPLEIKFVYFLHQLASWWLIDSGTQYLMQLK